eukprot:gene15638-21747_t
MMTAMRGIQWRVNSSCEQSPAASKVPPSGLASRQYLYSLASLALNPYEWLAVSSDKGTVHVFALSEAGTLPS